MEKFTDKELEEMLDNIEKPSDEIKLESTDTELNEEEFQFKEEDLDERLNTNQELDFDTIPDKSMEIYEDLDPVIVDRAKINLGLNTEELISLINYVSGKGPKPDFIDRFTTDMTDRMKDMILVMNEVLLASIPVKVALQNQVQERLFTPQNLYDMDSKTLSATSLNLSKEIQGNMNAAVNAIQVINNFGSTNSQYRQLLDRIMMLPEDKFNKIRDIVLTEDEK